MSSVITLGNGRMRAWNTLGVGMTVRVNKKDRGYSACFWMVAHDGRETRLGVYATRHGDDPRFSRNRSVSQQPVDDLPERGRLALGFLPAISHTSYGSFR